MSLAQLREVLERHADPDLTTAMDAVRICKTDHAVSPESSMSGTVLAVIAQGGKRLALGDRVYEYGAGQFLVASVDLPVTGHVIDATPEVGGHHRLQRVPRPVPFHPRSRRMGGVADFALSWALAPTSIRV